ncbi:MAG TPA: GNAT family N-acetyltransferase, partial [Thermopetrobacter sp.]|nr:GNAT family N-acetyltransferase [Thermopetrobacter sp.]
WRAFELALKPSARRARRKRLNRMRRAGEVRFHVHDDPRRIAGLIDIALAWKRDWLANRGIADGLPERAFFARLLKSLPRRDRSGGTRWLMAELTFDGRPVALDFGALRGDVFHAYLSAYDAALSAHSPGKVALWLMMQWCMERGLSSYDMLANPAPYKEDWANARRPLLHLVHPVTLAGQAYALWAARLREVAQHCYEALPEGLRGTLSAPLRRLRDGLARGKH